MRRRATWLLTLTLLLAISILATSGLILAAPKDQPHLDRTFGGGSGKVLTPFARR